LVASRQFLNLIFTSGALSAYFSSQANAYFGLVALASRTLRLGERQQREQHAAMNALYNDLLYNK
jgi:hypothetical protein